MKKKDILWLNSIYKTIIYIILKREKSGWKKHNTHGIDEEDES